jgi:hypothetical protein
MEATARVQPSGPVSDDLLQISLHQQALHRAAARAMPEAAVVDLPLPEVDEEPAATIAPGVVEALEEDVEENGYCPICGEVWVCSFYRRMGVTPYTP